MGPVVRPALDAQTKYGINALYIIAHAAWESGWGKSRICREKNNWFGWGAADDNPYVKAGKFVSTAACIDYVMGRIKIMYLSPRGSYYSGACLGQGGVKAFGMNKHYASDPRWGKGIAATMNKIASDYAKATT